MARAAVPGGNAQTHVLGYRMIRYVRIHQNTMEQNETGSVPPMLVKTLRPCIPVGDPVHPQSVGGGHPHRTEGRRGGRGDLEDVMHGVIMMQAILPHRN